MELKSGRQSALKITGAFLCGGVGWVCVCVGGWVGVYVCVFLFFVLFSFVFLILTVAYAFHCPNVHYVLGWVLKN